MQKNLSQHNTFYNLIIFSISAQIYERNILEHGIRLSSTFLVFLLLSFFLTQARTKFKLLFVNFSSPDFFFYKIYLILQKGPHKLIKGRITTISFSLFSWAQKKLHFLGITIFCVPRSESTCYGEHACSEHKEAKIFWMKTPKCSAGFICSIIITEEVEDSYSSSFDLSTQWIEWIIIWWFQ